MLTLGAVMTIMVPTLADEAKDHAMEVVGEPSSVYEWMCPSEDGSSYSLETLEMRIGTDDYLSSGRSDAFRQGTRMVECPYNLVDPEDPFVQTVAGHIDERTQGRSDEAKANAALSFVQCAVSYISDDLLFGCEEFWAAPAETLYLRMGDCEDTSTLLCSIYLAMGLRCAMLDMPGHVAVGWYAGDGDDLRYCETVTSYPRPMEEMGIEPGMAVYDDFSGSLLTEINGILALYRDMIRSVAGT